MPATGPFPHQWLAAPFVASSNTCSPHHKPQGLVKAVAEKLLMTPNNAYSRGGGLEILASPRKGSRYRREARCLAGRPNVSTLPSGF